MPVGMIPLGFLAEKVGIQTAFLACAGLMFAGILCTHLLVPEVAKIRRGHTDHVTSLDPSESVGNEEWNKPVETPMVK